MTPPAFIEDSPVDSPAIDTLMPAEVKKDLLSGTSALAVGVTVERGCSFLANILAARLGGAATFGVYALAISTANNISAYAAGGIGSTAIRFSGEHPRGSAGYPTLARVLAVISSVSALLAAVTLWLGAVPIARLLQKQSVVGALQWAALSAAGIIMLECCRGFLVGNRRIKALLLLSSLVGAGYLSLLPAMARYGPKQMIASQSAVTLGAVLICLLCYRQLGLTSPTPIKKAEPVGPLLKQVWGFGFVQLAGLIGMNAAGWWLTTLIARSDSSMVQMGFFAIAHQLRNMVALAPSLLTEGSLAVMARRHGHFENTPDNVMAVCAYACTLASLVLAGLGIIVVPWGLVLLYGQSYAAAGAVTAIALATAVIHMGSAPISARLSIVSIKATGAINTIWAVFVATVATLVLLRGGNAAKGATVYLAGHLLCSILQIAVLKQRKCIPPGTILAFTYAVLCALVLAALACVRDARPGATAWTSAVMSLILAGTILAMVAIGKRRGWLPSPDALRALLSQGLSFVRLRAKIATSTQP